MVTENSSRKDRILKARRGFSSRLASFFACAAFAVYAIYPTISTAEESAGQCTINTAKIDSLKKAASGHFTNLRFAEDPYYGGALRFIDNSGQVVQLSDFKGKTVLLNLWATWCVPCREEMPELAHLQEQQGGKDFIVVAVNIDRKTDDQVFDFLKSVKADKLSLYRDKSMEIFQMVKREGLGLGLPVTILFDAEGCMMASYNGSAPWGDENAMKLIETAKELNKPAAATAADEAKPVEDAEEAKTAAEKTAP